MPQHEKGSVLRPRCRAEESVTSDIEDCKREREDTGKDCDVCGDSTEPNGVMRGNVEKDDHHGCDEPRVPENTRSTCPGLPKSLSKARDNVPFNQ